MIHFLAMNLRARAWGIPAQGLRLAAAGALLALPGLAGAASVTVDGAQTYQVIEGFGVNANHRSWNNNELQPVLDALIDHAGMTLFRVVFDNADWEMTNDNNDPDVMNWDYYGPIYAAPDFQKMWDMIRYLNQKGITNGVMPNFQGFGPAWMSLPYPDYRSLAPGFEDEWAEMIASALVYARYTNHLQFSLVAPNNEPDLPGSGFGIATAAQYLTTLRALARQLDATGLGDLRFVGPDLSDSGLRWLPEIMADPVVMARLGHFGLHSYSNPGLNPGVSDFIHQSAYPDRTFWLTEFNVWCDVCQSGVQGTNSWEYSRGTAEYLLYHLANNASAGLVWEGYDSLYFNNYNDDTHWSSWGLFSLDDTNAVPKTYTPRKGFYTLAQISKFIRPGARRIDLSSSDAPLMVAAYHAGTGRLTLAGVNTDTLADTISGTLTNLPAIASLELYFTDAANNLRDSGPVPVTNGSFTVTIPADCVFTLTSPDLGSDNPSPLLTLRTNGNGKIFPDLGNRTLTIGQTCTLVAVPDPGQGFAGWSGGITSSAPRLTFTLTTNLVLEADFVPGSFTPAKGAYNGLFYEADGASLPGSGSVSITTTSKGSFSGRLLVAGARYSLTGSFDADGRARPTIARRNLGPLTIELQMDLAQGADGITGTVTDGTWLAALSAERAAFDGKTASAPEAGQYTIVITGNRASISEPGGDGYGTVTVSTAGKVRVAGWLADGTFAGQVVPLSRTGEWPLYVSLYGGKGFVSGWITFTNVPAEDLNGGLRWTKPTLSKAKYYPGGFTMRANLSGSAYHPPSRGQKVAGFSDAVLALRGGTSAASITNYVTLNSDNRVSNLSSNKLSLGIKLASGLFKGALTDPSRSKPIQFNGVILQKQDLGRGFFTDADQTARVFFGPPPPAAP